MRLIANIKDSNQDALRLMIYDSEDSGVYVFGYNTLEDSDAEWDCWFANLEDAYELGKEYGIDRDKWTLIDDPHEFCQHDWIAPVRIIGRNLGKPEWGNLEKLVEKMRIKI